MADQDGGAKPDRKNPPPARADVAGDLASARRRGDGSEAERVVVDALEQEQAHLLDPDDLVWLVAEVGAWESSWRAGQAVAHWLYHHGPVHGALIRTAEEIAAGDDAQWCDEVLLWIDPSPQRWYMLACWHTTCFCGPDPVENCGQFARWVIAERGDTARRSLRTAFALAEPDTRAREILEVWAAALA